MMMNRIYNSQPEKVAFRRMQLDAAEMVYRLLESRDNRTPKEGAWRNVFGPLVMIKKVQLAEDDALSPGMDYPEDFDFAKYNLPSMKAPDTKRLIEIYMAGNKANEFFMTSVSGAVPACGWIAFCHNSLSASIIKTTQSDVIAIPENADPLTRVIAAAQARFEFFALIRQAYAFALIDTGDTQYSAFGYSNELREKAHDLMWEEIREAQLNLLTVAALLPDDERIALTKLITDYRFGENVSVMELFERNGSWPSSYATKDRDDLSAVIDEALVERGLRDESAIKKEEEEDEESLATT